MLGPPCAAQAEPPCPAPSDSVAPVGANSCAAAAAQPAFHGSVTVLPWKIEIFCFCTSIMPEGKPLKKSMAGHDEQS